MKYGMVRKQYYISPQQEVRLKRLAQVERKPEAELVREFIDAGLATRRPVPPIHEALAEIWAMGRNITAPADVSVRIDDYLYGDAE